MSGTPPGTSLYADSPPGLFSDITSDEFEAFANSFPRVFIHFWASWNAYDRGMKPLMLRHAERLRGIVLFGAIDVDCAQELCQRANLYNVPWFHYYENGVLTDSGVLHRNSQVLHTMAELFEPSGLK